MDSVILAFDTATTTASIALYDADAGQLLSEWTWQARRRQTQDLLTTAQTMLRQSHMQVEEVTAVAVTTGPGSFTGVRIAISAVKGIGIGLVHTPRVIGIPTLCVTAAPWLALAGGDRNRAPLICAYIQAGRGRYNWLLFAHETADALPQPTVRSGLLVRPTAADHQAGTAAEFAAALTVLAPRPVWLVGEPTADLESALAGLSHVCLVDAVSGLRRAGHLARLAAQWLGAGVEDSLAALQPLYIRTP